MEEPLLRLPVGYISRWKQYNSKENPTRPRTTNKTRIDSLNDTCHNVPLTKTKTVSFKTSTPPTKKELLLDL